MATATETTTTAAASDTATTHTFTIGTRRSVLARVQADEIAKALRHAWPDRTFAIHAMATAGDNNQTTALHKFNEKSLWTQDLEVLLQSGELDLIVHCLKDMPTQIPVGLEISSITAREDPRDALVVKKSLAATGRYNSLADLPAGSVVGTSSLRRIAQLKRHHPHLRFRDVRGSIGTRLAKLDDEAQDYSAIVIAVAGLARLGMSDRITTYLSKSNGGMLYAVGQGALAIETREGDDKVKEMVAKVACQRTTLSGLAERSLMRTLEGGCSVPIGVETEWITKQSSLEPGVGVGVKPAEAYHNITGLATSAPENTLTDELLMRAIVVSLDGTDAAEIEARRLVTTAADAEEFGWDAASMLVDRGAAKILEQIELNRRVIDEQGKA